MFDMLTLDDLYNLHAQLCADHDANHQRMIGPDGKTRMSTFSDEWAVLSAKQSEINETAEAVYREAQRRYETVYPCCQHCAHSFTTEHLDPCEYGCDLTDEEMADA